jgi:hypothetical protein
MITLIKANEYDNEDNDINNDQNDDRSYEEYAPDEDEDTHQANIDEDIGDENGSSAAEEWLKQNEAEQNKVGSLKTKEPSKEDILALRQHTEPWDRRARDWTAINADSQKNPVLAQKGRLIEAREKGHKDRTSAYKELTNSPKYINADPMKQMEMDDQFERTWHTNNPDHIEDIVNQHGEIDKGNREDHARWKESKKANIAHVLSGGAASPDAMSMEEGMQHAGGVRSEEGTQGAIAQDPAAAFAAKNQDFIRQAGKVFAAKNKNQPIVENEDYNNSVKKDINDILGPAAKGDAKFQQFMSDHYPLIRMNGKSVLSKLGLDKNHPSVDHGLLDFAGMHGLIQAINTYDHDHPSKSSFKTHANHRIRGAQMEAMKAQDAIPRELRQGAKAFDKEQATTKPQQVQAPSPVIQQPKTDIGTLISESGHPNAPDMADRLKRVSAARTTIRRPAGTVVPKVATPIPQLNENEEGEE